MTDRAPAWLALPRPGDWLVFLGAAAAVGASFPWLWQGGGAERAVVRRDGAVVAELSLDARRTVAVQGHLGETRIAVEPGRARVASDPGPQQYCVRQGWLRRPGEVAICAPSHVSLQIVGRDPLYDTLGY